MTIIMLILKTMTMKMIMVMRTMAVMMLRQIQHAHDYGDVDGNEDEVEALS